MSAVSDLGPLLLERSLPLIERVRFDGKADGGLQIRVCAKSPDFRPGALTDVHVLTEIVVDVSKREPRFVMGQLILVQTQEARGLMYSYHFIPGQADILADIHFVGVCPWCNIKELRFLHGAGIAQFPNHFFCS
ncbi:hypothetical protein EXS71_00385 [Candidatus Uhrbacteria bacterium]|nr:hypothetical protein [Candidatus Uhrbacteria bacterium]